ncbi:MAG: hypothetical protein WBP56_11185 [Polyangia bacterium]
MVNTPSSLGLEIASKAAIETTKAVAAGAALAVGLATGGLAIAPAAFGRLFQVAVERRFQKKFGKFMTDIADALGCGSVEEAEKKISECIDEEGVHGAVVAAGLAILNDIDEAAIPYLARVTALQIDARTTKRQDRRVVSLLADCNSSTLEALKWLLDLCRSAARPGSEIDICIAIANPGSQPPGTAELREHHIRVVEKGQEAETDRGAYHLATASRLEAVGLLERNTFTQRPRGTWGGENLYLSRADLDYLVRRFL